MPELPFAPAEYVEYYKDKDLKEEEDINSEEEIPSSTSYQAILPWEQTRKIISSLTQKSSESKQLPITIPFGFQRIKRLLHGRNQKLYSVLFIPQTTTSEYIVSLDRNNMHIWKGTTRVKRISVFDVTLKNQARIEDAAKRGVRNIRHWMFLEKYKVYLVSSSTLQLRVSMLHF